MVAAPCNCGGKAADGSTNSRPLQSIREAVSVHRIICMSTIPVRNCLAALPPYEVK